MIIKKAEKECIAIASKHLIEKKIIIIPTDTVYGFSGLMDTEIEHNLNNIKKRDKGKKLIYLIKKPGDILNYIDVNFYNTQELNALMSFWPAPLTIIFRAREKDTTIAFRCPDNLWLKSLLHSVEQPIFSTSANISGKSIIGNVQELITTFGKEVSLIVDAGKMEGLSSTILDSSKKPFSIIRAGSFQLSDMAKQQHFFIKNEKN